MMPRSVILLTTVFLLTFFHISYAQNNSEPVTLEGTEDTCEQATAEIDEKIDAFKTKNLEHTKTYSILQLELDTIAKKGDLLGYDTDQLYTDMNELDTLILDFSRKFNLFITNLTATKNFVCLDNENPYAVAKARAISSLEDLKDSVSEITTFYNDSIIESVLGLEMIEQDE